MALFLQDYNGAHRLVRIIKSATEVCTNADLLLIKDDCCTFYPEKIMYPLSERNQEDFAALHSGDIIEITNTGRCFRRFDVTENDATIYLGGQCNSNCVMCPSFDEERQESPEDEEYVRQFIELLPDELPNYVVTGGEPTMQLNLFFESMGRLAEKIPKAEALLLTNGRSFSSEKVLDRLLMHCPPFLTVAVPVHGSTSKIHDTITNSDGSFEQTMQGILNLLNRHMAVEVRIVVTQLNKDDVENIADMICDRFPSVLRVNFISLEVRGNCLINRESVYISPKESFDKSKKAIQKLLAKGIDVGLYNYPLCHVDPGYWFLCKKSISPNKVSYAKECSDCELEDKCGGIFVTTMKATKLKVVPI